LSYLGTAWRRDIAFAGYGVALQGDFSAGEMIRGVKEVDPERRDKLIKLLRIDEDWRMMRVSDGQRRRYVDDRSIKSVLVLVLVF
jgi:CCR4-NOT complex subunit CAF16